MIDKTATISQDANIASDVKIGAFSTVDSDVTIGKGSIIDAHVHISSGVTIGKNIHIFSHVDIGNGVSQIEICDNTNIREFVKIGTSKENTKPIYIGNTCYILGYSEISEDTRIEDECILSNNAIIGSNCTIQKGAIIGAKSSVSSDCIIGQGSMIGGVTDVTSNIPPYCMAEGKPNAEIRGLNIVGISRNTDVKESSRYIKRAYMALKKRGFSKQSAAEMLHSISNKHAKIFVEFIAKH